MTFLRFLHIPTWNISTFSSVVFLSFALGKSFVTPQNFSLGGVWDTASSQRTPKISVYHSPASFSTNHKIHKWFYKPSRKFSISFYAASGEFFFSLLIWKTVGELMNSEFAHIFNSFFPPKRSCACFSLLPSMLTEKSLMLFLCTFTTWEIHARR